MIERRFEEYICFLKENFSTLVEYKELTGGMDPTFYKVRDDLFDKDPFVVFNASMEATALFADKNIYH